MSKTIKCGYDGKPYPETHFYQANDSSIFKELGYIPICKTCISKIAKDFYSSLKNKRLSVFLTCMKIDVGFDSDLYDELFEDTSKVGVDRITKTYLENHVKSEIKYKNFTELGYALGLYDLLDSYLSAKEKVDDDVDLDYIEYQVTDEDKVFWGESYTQEEYYFLSLTFVEYADSYSINTPSSEELLKQICLTTLEIRNAREDDSVPDKVVTELTDRLLKLMSDSNMKPNQKANHNASRETFGTLVQKIEEEKPVMEVLDEWEKNDFFKDVEVVIVGQIARMLGKPISKEYQEYLDEYTVTPDDS